MWLSILETRNSSSSHANPPSFPVGHFSKRIAIARTTAIFFVVFVHVQPGMNPIEEAPLYMTLIRFFSITILGFASVPLLSVIGGYLFMISATRKPWQKYIKDRLLTLYVPLVFWSASLALLLVVTHAIGVSSSLYERFEMMPIYDSIFALSDRPINYPLYFLRDMAVISLFSPVLLFMGNRFPIVLLAITGAAYAMNIGNPVIVRPMTLFFFSCGIVAYSYRFRVDALDKYLPYIIAISVAFWAWLSFHMLHNPEYINPFLLPKPLEFINRVFVIVTVWVCVGRLCSTPISNFLVKMEKISYLAFLSHVVVITVLGGLFKLLLGGYEQFEYLLYFLASPFICFTCAWILSRMLAFFPNWLQITLSGKRTQQSFR